jgi:hypothetical protein
MIPFLRPLERQDNSRTVGYSEKWVEKVSFRPTGTVSWARMCWYRRGISQNRRFFVSVKQREGRCILAGAALFFTTLRAVVQVWLGHESLATTQKYLEPSKEPEKQLEEMKLPF